MEQLIISIGNQIIKRINMSQTTYLIGRGDQCDIILNDRLVSTKHARITQVEHGFTLQDLQSTNGTYINQHTITLQTLQNGDTIRLGRHQLCYQGGYSLQNQINILAIPARKKQPFPAWIEIMQGAKSGWIIGLTADTLCLGESQSDHVLIMPDINGRWNIQHASKKKIKETMLLLPNDAFIFQGMTFKFHQS